MRRAYSTLRFVIDGRGLALAELRRRMARDRQACNVKTLYRLADPDRPLERVDLRAVGSICETLGIGIGDLIVFSERATPALKTLSDSKQRRLDDLMARHNEGALHPRELDGFRELVAEAEEIARSNASRLADQRRQLLGASRMSRGSNSA